MKKRKNPSIIISPEVHEHLAPHFNSDLPGSKFYDNSPEELLEKAIRLSPEKFRETQPDDDGRIRISIQFPENIGVSNVVSINELTPEEKEKIKIVDRRDRKVRSVKTNRTIPTKECQIILSDDWQLITIFPGELAPPLPASPDIHDDYWDHHVFIEPIST